MRYRIFAFTTREYMVSGLMPQLSVEFGVSLPAIGYLVTIYAGTMAIGGPLPALRVQEECVTGTHCAVHCWAGYWGAGAGI